jgi:polyhydroxybutyrate depolymerase
MIVWLLAGLALMPQALSLETADGRERTYLVHVPAGLDPDRPAPVVLVLHGGGGSSEGMRALAGMDAVADAEGFLVVYPQGVGPERLGSPAGTWNAGLCCGEAMEENVDDVAFFRALLDRLEQDFSVDPRRIYATGHSNGSQMSFRLACELADRIAAVAPVGAQGVHGACDPSRPVPVMYFHGSEDACSPYEGSETCGGCFHEFLERIFMTDLGEPVTWPCEPVPDYVAAWAQRNGCSHATDVSLTAGDVVCETYRDCSEGADTTLCTMDSTGHTWPGGTYGPVCDNPDGLVCQTYVDIVGAINHDVGAADMWRFFRDHPMPAPDDGDDGDEPDPDDDPGGQEMPDRSGGCQAAAPGAGLSSGLLALVAGVLVVRLRLRGGRRGQTGGPLLAARLGAQPSPAREELLVDEEHHR